MERTTEALRARSSPRVRWHVHDLLSTVFLRGVREGTVTPTVRLVHKGRTTIVAETELTDARGRPVARTTQTQSVLMPRTG